MLRSPIARLVSAMRHLLGFRHASPMDARLQEELRFHIEMQTEKNLARGMPPADARRAALLSFGGTEKWREAARDEVRSRPLQDFTLDLRFALRTLRSAPAFTAAAVLTLAIGIGANTAIFSAVDGVLLKPLPFSHSERIVALYQNDRKKGVPRDAVAPGNFAEWHGRSRAFSGMAVAEPFGLVYSGPEGEEEIGNWNVTQDYFSVLDARPVLGRVFEPSDYQPGRGQVLVLTYASWQRRFGGDPAIIGRTLTISHKPATIVGVLPRSFAYLSNSRTELYAPKVLDSGETQLRGAAWYQAVGRLAPGVTLDAAAGDMNRVAMQLAHEYPQTNANIGVTVLPLRDGIVGDSAHTLLLLLGAVALVLMIACTNVANLLLARTNRRGREFAIRMALGAGRGRIVRQVLAESFLIAVAGGAAGVALARWGVGAIRALSPASLPRIDDIGVDMRALTFTLSAVVLTTFIFGLVPALRAARADAQDELKAGGRAAGGVGQHVLRRVLVAAEIALAVMLLVGAGLLVKSFASVVRQDRGFRSDHLLTATLFIWEGRRTAQSRAEFASRLVDGAAALPGVTAAGVTTSLPLGSDIGADHGAFTIVGRPVEKGQEPNAHITALSAGAFDALGMVRRRGRVFTPHDDASSTNVVVINEVMARRFWPGEDPMGKRINVGFYGPPIEREVVGVVADIRQEALDAAPDPAVYLPHAQAASGGIMLVMRTASDPAQLTRDVKRMVTSLDPRLPIASMQTMDAVVSDSLRPRRFMLMLLGCFSVAALLLAVIGVYGVMTHSTAERARELGVRIALGAQTMDIIQMVMRDGLGAAATGVALGLAGAAALSGLEANMLYGVTRLDPLTFGAVGALMLATAAVACYVPARRATRVDPLVALRAN